MGGWSDGDNDRVAVTASATTTVLVATTSTTTATALVSTETEQKTNSFLFSCLRFSFSFSTLSSFRYAQCEEGHVTFSHNHQSGQQSNYYELSVVGGGGDGSDGVCFQTMHTGAVHLSCQFH